MVKLLTIPGWKNVFVYVLRMEMAKSTDADPFSCCLAPVLVSDSQDCGALKVVAKCC